MKLPSFNKAFNQELNEGSLDFDSGLAAVIVTLSCSVWPHWTEKNNPKKPEV